MFTIITFINLVANIENNPGIEIIYTFTLPSDITCLGTTNLNDIRHFLSYKTFQGSLERQTIQRVLRRTNSST